MNDPAGSYLPQWLIDLSTVMGALGFLVTLYVWREVRTIRRSFRMRARLPELIRALQRSGSALNEVLIGGWDSGKNEAFSQLKSAAVLLKTAAAFLPWSERKALLAVHKRLLRATRSGDGPRYLKSSDGWDLYGDIQSCITTLQQVAQNLKWQ